MAKADLTAQRLRELVTYDPDIGVFTRRVATGFRKQHPAGAVLGATKTKTGHLCFRVDGSQYLSHRLAWLYTYGEWPSKQIDHINGNPRDNSLKNLREVSQQVNTQNQRRAHKDNKTGYLGVHALRDKFVASLAVSGKTKHIGIFETPEQAHAAYLIAKRASHAGNTL